LDGADLGARPEQGLQAAPGIAIKVRDLVVGFGDKLVMQGLDLDVYRGEVLGFVGGSGTGKSVLTRTILGLSGNAAGRSRFSAPISIPSRRANMPRSNGASA